MRHRNLFVARAAIVSGAVFLTLSTAHAKELAYPESTFKGDDGPPPILQSRAEPPPQARPQQLAALDWALPPLLLAPFAAFAKVDIRSGCAQDVANKTTNTISDSDKWLYEFCVTIYKSSTILIPDPTSWFSYITGKTGVDIPKPIKLIAKQVFDKYMTDANLNKYGSAGVKAIIGDFLCCDQVKNTKIDWLQCKYQYWTAQQYACDNKKKAGWTCQDCYNCCKALADKGRIDDTNWGRCITQCGKVADSFNDPRTAGTRESEEDDHDRDLSHCPVRAHRRCRRVCRSLRAPARALGQAQWRAHH